MTYHNKSADQVDKEVHEAGLPRSVVAYAAMNDLARVSELEGRRAFGTACFQRQRAAGCE